MSLRAVAGTPWLRAYDDTGGRLLLITEQAPMPRRGKLAAGNHLLDTPRRDSESHRNVTGEERLVAQAIPAISQVNIVGYRLVPPEDLLAHPHNPRRHPALQREALRASLRQIGWIAPVLVNVQTQHVLDGHARIEEAISAGMEGVPVLEVDVPPEQEGLVLATFDPIAAMAVLDSTALGTLMAEVQTDETALKDLMTGLASGPYLPNYTPTIGRQEYDQQDITAAGDRLASQFTAQREHEAVMCPHCGEGFFLDADR